MKDFVQTGVDDQRRSRDAGFSLVELMVTLSVAGVLMALAVPPLQRLVTARAVVAQADELAASLRLARSEAMKRGMAVSVCASSTTADASPSCADSTDWTSGWLVFSDPGMNGSLDAGERLLKVQGPITSVQSIDGSVTFAAFHQNGISATGSEPTFIVKPNLSEDAAGYDAVVRRVVQNKQGRVQILVGAEE